MERSTYVSNSTDQGCDVTYKKANRHSIGVTNQARPAAMFMAFLSSTSAGIAADK